MDKTKEIAQFETNGQIIPAIADNTLIAIADQVEKRLEAMGKIKKMALKLTNRHDWVDESGKPYLQASGAEKVARLFGISWRISEPVLENLEGGHFSYTYKGEFSLSGTSIEAVGTRSSKDRFFKKYEYQDKGEFKQRIELPPSEIDRGDVKKAAYTNLLGNGITRLLGIRNLTYEDLKEFAGITAEQITSVEYKKGGGKPAPAQPTKAPAANPDEPISVAQTAAIKALLIKLAIKDDLAMSEKVAAILELKEIPTALNKLTKAQGGIVIDRLNKEVSGDSREGFGS